jgi:hypothetical protein
MTHGRTVQLLCPRIAINKLSDDSLLEIFSLYMACSLSPQIYKEDAWHTLVHVCRRWRSVVFGSPRRLDLQLFCANKRLLKTLDIWPDFPIVIHADKLKINEPPSITNAISSLKRNDRVCKIGIDNVPNSLLKELGTTSDPFPALIELRLMLFEEDPDPPIPLDSFLGGPVPHQLSSIPFPAIGKLLLSTRNLVTLSLDLAEHSGYISPEAMVTILSVLTRLKSLCIIFLGVKSRGASRRQDHPTLTRVVLPALTYFYYHGNRKYLEGIVSRIEAPLDSIVVSFSNELVISDIPLLRDFIGLTKIPDVSHQADISFSNISTEISLSQRNGDFDFEVEFSFSRYRLAELSLIAQACKSFLPPLPNLHQLGIYFFDRKYLGLYWQCRAKNSQWIDLLRPFIAVKDLTLGEPVVESVASALQEIVGERVTEILPALRNIFLESFELPGSVPNGIAKFTAARELSGRPVIVYHQEVKL